MLMLKKTIAALSLLSILAACQNDENPSQPEPKPRQDINLTRAEQEFMDKGTDFAFRFFDQVCSTEKEKPNVFVSPLSASLCLLLWRLVVRSLRMLRGSRMLLMWRIS